MMGGLRRKMPVTFWTFVAGTLALAGVPPFSGFYSKDSILGLAWGQPNYALFALGALVAALTAFYMFRLVFVVFLGETRSTAAGHAHESPPVMVWPLRLLAVLSIVGGIIGLENVYGRQFGAEHALSTLEQLVAPLKESPVAAAIGLLAAVLGIAGAWSLYGRAPQDPLPAKLGGLSVAMRNRFYWDEIYQALFIRPHDFLAALAGWFDRWIIAGLGVRGVHGSTELAGRALRLLQTGNLQTYAFLFVLGVACVLYFALR